MRSVSASLEPLSSPSPSPSPPPPQSNERAVSQPTTAGGAGLDSGSELSELTEEEQETENHSNGDENGEELDEDEEEEDVEGTRRQPLRRGGGRRKRGGMVPAPMWDWAYKQKKNVERGVTAPEEEEEEEEQPSPPKAMEEEEDEEDDSGHTSMRASVNGNAVEDEDEKDEEDEPVDADHADTGHKKKKKIIPRYIFAQKSAASQAALHAALLGISDGDSEDDDDEEEEEPDVEEDGDIPQLNLDAADAVNDSDSDPDLDAPPTGLTTVPIINVHMDVDIDASIDITASSKPAVAPTVAAAGSSIMAGSSILASATPSPNSSLSGSPSSSRSASPAQERADEDEDDDDDNDDADDTTPVHKRVGKKQPSGDDDTGPLQSAASTIDGIKSKLSHKDAEAEDLEVASVLHDELDLEIDADLQPAHRAEALDVLATIELKFALLRERVYVEKMEGLAWEEALVAEGTHPEYVYLQSELSRREAKRKELAARQRTYDIALVTKKRKMDEDFIWGWWKFARDELQTDMVSEHKRKYRRLERDRRALGQPQPVRHIPAVPREVPPPPTLRQIVKSFPYPGNRLSSKKRDHTTANATPFVYPELSTLSSADISTDLEYLYLNRRAPFDPHSHRMGMSMSVSGPQLGPPNPAMTPMQQGGYDSYVMNVESNVNPQSTSGTRMPPPPPPYQHHTVIQPFQSNSGRSQHHPSHPQASSLHNHASGQFPVESEMTLVTVGSGHGHGHQYFGGPAAPGAPLGITRPISPVHVGGGPGGKQGAWVGDGRMPAGHHSGGKQGPEYGWLGIHEASDDGRDRDRENKRDRERERERERERDKRERSDRDRDREQQYERDRESYLIQQASQPHRHGPHSHPLNAPALSPHHHQGPHLHHRPHHHHHVLHHHHPQQPGNGGGPSVPPLAVPTGPSGTGSAPSPRIAASRDFESGRPHTGTVHATEILSLSASKPGGTPAHWKRDELSSSEYREYRSRHGSRPSSTHPAPGMYEDRERPLATPFAMASSQAMSSASASGLPNGQSVPPAHSPRLPWSDEHNSRIPPSSSSFPGPLGRGSPLGFSPPRSRPSAPHSPSSSLAFPGPMRSPTRYAPSDPPVMHSLSSSHGRSASTPTSPGLKVRGLGSPPPTKMGKGYSPPRLSGPGRTSTPTGLGPSVDIHNNTHSVTGPNTAVFSRTASPLTSFNSPSSHPSQPPASSRPLHNGNTTILPTPKTNAVQMVDGP